MTEYAQIVLRQRDLPLGRSYLQAVWEGPRDGLVKVPHHALRHILGSEPMAYPASLKVDGIRLRLVGEVDDDFLCDRATYARAGGANVFVWLWAVLSVWASWALEEFYYRALLTLSVWGCARVPQGQRPSWRHIGIKR